MKQSRLTDIFQDIPFKLQSMLPVPKYVSEGMRLFSIKNSYAQITYLFLLIEVSFLFVLMTVQESKSQRYLDIKTAEAVSAYETVDHSFYKLSEIVADSINNNPKIINLLTKAGTADQAHQQLFAQMTERYIKEDFLNLKDLYFQEFEFTLPKGQRFLHLNKSELFGGSSIYVQNDRPSTSSSTSPFHFRHELYNEQKDRIGTLDFTLLPRTFTREMEKFLEVELQYVKIDDIASLLLKDDSKREPKQRSTTGEYFFEKKVMNDIAAKTAASQSFSMALKDDEHAGTVTFLAVDVGSEASDAYFIYFQDDPKLAIISGNYKVLELSGSLIITIIFVFIMIWTYRKRGINAHIAKKTQALHASNKMLQERYELTLEGVGDGIWDWNLLEDTIYFSKRWKEILGFGEDEIESAFHVWHERIHPEDVEKTMNAVSVNISGQSERFENQHRLKHKDGHWIWVLVRGKTMVDEAAMATRMLGTLTDVTERKALEDKVLENEARLIEAQKIAHLGNWEWNLSNHKITWSDELYRLLGEEPQSFQPTYKSIVRYLSASEKKRYRDNLRNILQNRQIDQDYTLNIIRKNGLSRIISATVKVIREKGRIVYVQGTFLDVTERKEAEEQLSLMNSMLVESYNKQKIKNEEITKAKQALEESHSTMMAAKADAEQASRSKSEFLANMSHEIRTPLNAINGFIGLLNDHETDPEKLNYLGIIKSSSASLLQIINDILDFSKIESGKLHIEQLDFNPEKEFSGTTDLFKLKASEKDIKLYFDGCDMLPRTLHGDALRLKQILSNLLSNAIKFTDNKGEIVCKIRYEEGRLSFNVKDNGIGIPLDKQKKIFESFTQADGSTVRKYGGTGLGLTVSAKLAELLGGELNVTSQEGVGSEFIFSAPFALGQHNDENSEIRVEKSKKLRGHTLLVEDNEANQMFIGIILRNAGLTYDTANNGIEAVEMFKNQKYKVILMDENMPKLNGVGATKKILQIEADQGLVHTPIIALTANALVGDRQHFLNAGMDDYLAKPLEPVQLIEKIKELIG